MKALMTNSKHPDIFAAKIRDDMYVKHLREVQKINNREALDLKVNLKQYHHVNDSHQKSKRKAKQFELNQYSNEIHKKNDLITQKIKNIRSMFGFKNPIKSARRSESLYIQNQIKENKIMPQSLRYHKQNEQKQSTNYISRQVSDEINTIKNSFRTQEQKRNRISLHYYLRKRQQQMIEHENQKLKKGILSQKSAYSPKNRKNNLSLKLPSVKTARHNFNQKQSQERTLQQVKQQNVSKQ